jgi:hypothetical protein
MRKENCKEEENNELQGILWKEVLLKVHLTRAFLLSCTASRHKTPATTRTADI